MNDRADVSLAPSPDAPTLDEPVVVHRLPSPGRRPVPTVALGALAIATGVALRFAARSPLWLDEAQSVAIARRSLPGVLDALRADGAPPLYYLLLNGWLRAFGDGDMAVRSLSVVASLAGIAVAWWAGTAIAGRWAGWITALVVATSPFAIRYGTEARMYALVLVLATALIGLAFGERSRGSLPGWRVAAFGVVGGALLLTHYWSLFLLAPLSLLLALDLRRGDREAGRLIRAGALGALPFLLWLPSFVHQAATTGAPWARPPGGAIVELAARGFAGGDSDAGRLLEVLLLGLAGAAVFTAGASPRARLSRRLVLLALTVLLLGAAATELTGEGFAPRHATVALAPLLLGVSLFVADLPSHRTAVTALVAILGLVAGAHTVTALRTQAAQAAAAIEARAGADDVVLACPDQLGPGLSRVLDRPFETYPAPRDGDETWVDWTDYRRRVRAADPQDVASELHARAGDRPIWLIWSARYAVVGGDCRRLKQALEELRPDGARVVRLRPRVLENAEVWVGRP